MPAVTIRNLSDETHRALKLRAAKHGRSMESELREILENASRPKMLIGSALAQFGEHMGGVELAETRGDSVLEPASFE